MARQLLLLGAMKATDLLTGQHHTVARLFKALETAETRADKRALFQELASTLAAHDAIERQIFYPACQDAMGLSDELGEALVEHGVVEFCLYQANEALGKADFSFKCKVLKEVVEHHVKEEEDEFFPKAEKSARRGQPGSARRRNVGGLRGRTRRRLPRAPVRKPTSSHGRRAPASTDGPTGTGNGRARPTA